VKKVCFVIILPLIMMIAAVSCSSTKNQKTSVAPPEPPSGFLPPVESVPETAVETDNGEEIPNIEDTVEEPVLAQEEPPARVVEPEPPVEVNKPEPPAVAVTPKPEPAPEPPKAVEPPTVSPAPRPEPPKVTTPLPAPAKPAAVPPPATEEKPPVKEEPPVIPQPRDGPELPYPTPSMSGQEDPMVFSRVVRATVGQLVEVPFRGTGWVYLGEAGAQRGIIYDSRRLDPEGQSFIFRTERAGEYALKFYRQDFIRDFIMNDYVQVIVGAPAETAGTGWFSPPAERGRIIAEPRWPSALTEAQSLRADSRPAQPDAGSTANPPAAAAPVQPTAKPPAETPVQPQTAPAATTPAVTPSATPPASPSTARPTTPPATPPAATTPAVTPTPPAAAPPAVPEASKNAAPELPTYADPVEYLDKAKEEFAAGRVASAISFLDRFCEHYPSGTDETCWLYGQFYEANSPSRNILAALNSYRRLVQEYPQSSRFDDARKRIAYLQRYYININ